MPRHRRKQGNGSNGGVPNWFFWTLAFLVLGIGMVFFVFGDWIW